MVDCKEIKIGEIYEYNTGLKVKCIEKNGCDGCIGFDHTEMVWDLCSPEERSDGKSVQFREVKE